MRPLALTLLASCGVQLVVQAIVPTPPAYASTAAEPPRTALLEPATAERQGFVPIVDVTGGNLLGGVKGNRWISAELAAPLIVGGERYRVVSDGVLKGTGSGSKATKGEVPCDWTHNVEITGAGGRTTDVRSETLAVGGTWDLFPHEPREIDVNLPVYREAVDTQLEAKNIAEPTVQIKRVVRVDLDGDGVDEVLIGATYYEEAGTDGSVSPNAVAGDYSVVLLRRLVNGTVVTVPLAESYYPQDEKFSAPLAHRLVGMMDLNGDGTLEVVVRSNYYEGFALAVLTVDGTSVTPVLQEACGV